MSLQTLLTGIYQHYKGPFYLVLGVAHETNEHRARIIGTAQHSETEALYEAFVNPDGAICVWPINTADQKAGDGEEFALYVPMYPHKGAGMSIRPLEMFLEIVPHPMHGAGGVPRFKYIGPVLTKLQVHTERTRAIESTLHGRAGYE